MPPLSELQSIETLRRAYIKAVIDYRRSWLQCFKDQYESIAVELINQHGISPRDLTDWFDRSASLVREGLA